VKLAEATDEPGFRVMIVYSLHHVFFADTIIAVLGVLRVLALAYPQCLTGSSFLVCVLLGL
jgi:hypothetical protein